MSPRAFLFTAIASPLLLTSLARAQDVKPPSAEDILRELDSIEQRREQSKDAARNALLAKLQAAAASGPAASSLYSEAVEAVQFEGKKDRAQDTLEWKKKNADALRSRDLQSTLQLYLRYVVLSIQRRQSENPDAFVQPSLAYVTSLVQSYSDLQSAPIEDVRKMMNQPMADSVIGKWLRLGEWLPDDNKSWEPRAGDVAGILEKNVRIPLRAAKDATILQVWDMQMKFEADRATAGRLTHGVDEFNKITVPKLAFNKAKDMAAIGQPNRAVTEMFTLVRTYPEHPDFASWVAAIRQALKTSQSAGTSQ